MLQHFQYGHAGAVVEPRSAQAMQPVAQGVAEACAAFLAMPAPNMCNPRYSQRHELVINSHQTPKTLKICRAHLQRVELGAVVEAEGVRDLSPGQELVHELAGAVGARGQRLPRHPERRDHAQVQVRRQPAHAISAAARVSYIILNVILNAALATRCRCANSRLTPSLQQRAIWDYITLIYIILYAALAAGAATAGSRHSAAAHEQSICVMTFVSLHYLQHLPSYII